MRLQDLLAEIEVTGGKGPTDLEITGLAYDSRRVKPGDVFFALRGEQADGRRFVHAAVEAGAVAVVAEELVDAARATAVVVPSARRAMAAMAAAFFGRPAAALRVTAVTGTNGKTTFCFLLKHICETALMRSGLIGTVRYEIGERMLPAARTTPESLDLQEMLAQMVAAGCRAAVMEASSHAIDQDRVQAIGWDVVVFTNLTQDHLDYHGTMENYAAAKTRLFELAATQAGKRAKAVLNRDDRHGARLAEQFAKRLPVATYGLGHGADFRGSDIRIDWGGSAFRLDAGGRSFLVRLPLIGRYNIYNALAALAAAHGLGIELRTAVKALADAPPTPGRLEPVPGKRPFKVFVDYAHTPDALTNVIAALRELDPARLIVVFGCGGNRDRAKRPLMAAAVERGADHVIVTSDNPRKEDPAAIIHDIRQGLGAGVHEEIVDRREAIFRAISLAAERDIVLIAGKGHEKYQEYADHTVPFDDVQVARQAIEARLADTGGGGR